MFSFARITRSSTWAACGGSLALAVAGCSGGHASASSPSNAATGTVSLPLSTVANGVTYQLVNADFEIFSEGRNFFETFLTSNGPDGGATDLSTTLPTGSYEVDLLFGWTLERQDAQGNLTPVTATLTSNSFADFSIDNGTTTTVTFTFETDGVIVVIGSGALNIAIGVDTVDAGCTPLGNDCASGSWCPPASLTGSDLSCVPAGVTAVGEPCSDPTSCVANASCFQVGTGTFCEALCPSSDFDLPCATGGTCQSATSDYGVCVTGDAGVVFGGGTSVVDAGASPFLFGGDQ